MSITLSPVPLALLAGLFIWGCTTVGAGMVFLVRTPKLLQTMTGAAAGVMLAATYWSLLAPALESDAEPWILVICFVVGGLLILLPDIWKQHIRPECDDLPSCQLRGRRLWWAITCHNIPEGLAVGAACGATLVNPDSLTPALALALGIGVQNIPEGAAVSAPLLEGGRSRTRAFGLSVLSGAVEPVAALLGAVLFGLASSLLPYTLTLAAGAMCAVVFEDMVPEARKAGVRSTVAALLGFAFMMLLDVML